MHCEFGIDRTGIIVALLLDFLEIDRKYIIEEYKLSYSFSNENKLKELFNYIDVNYKGVKNFLVNKVNISKEKLEFLKEVLLI